MDRRDEDDYTDEELEAISVAADAIVDQRVFYQPNLFSTN